MYQKDLADWAFKELQLTTLSSQPTISRLCKKRSHAYDERVLNPNRKRKSEGMNPKIEKALLTWVNKNAYPRRQCFFGNDKRDGH